MKGHIDDILGVLDNKDSLQRKERAAAHCPKLVEEEIATGYRWHVSESMTLADEISLVD